MWHLEDTTDICNRLILFVVHDHILRLHVVNHLVHRLVEPYEHLLVLRGHLFELVTVVAQLLRHRYEDVVELFDLGLLILNEAHGLAARALCLLECLGVVGDFGEERATLVLMIRLLVIFNQYIHALHILINELTVEAEQLLSDRVSSCPERFTKFFLLVRRFEALRPLRCLSHGIAASLNRPLNKLDQLDRLDARVEPGHLLCVGSRD